MKNQELNLLFIFDAIMTERSITRAADRLAMTQPAVSNAVSRMRYQWKDPLFVKSGRNIEPTSYALNLWEQIRRPMHELTSAVETNLFDPATSKRRFRIGVSDMMVDLMWLPLRQLIECEAPGVAIHAVPSGGGVTSLLLQAQVDLVMGPFGGPHNEIRTASLFESHFACAMRRDHPLAGRPLSLEDFVAADHLLVSLSGEPTGLVDRALNLQGLSRHVAMTVNHFSTVPKILTCSNLIAVAPSVVLGKEEYRAQLWVTESPVDIQPSAMSLGWHIRHDHDLGLVWLREKIQAIVSCESRRCTLCAEQGLPAAEALAYSAA